MDWILKILYIYIYISLIKSDLHEKLIVSIAASIDHLYSMHTQEIYLLMQKSVTLENSITSLFILL